MKILPLLTAACLLASPSLADLHVEFVEGAPKDRFVVTNTGNCPIDAAMVTIDLSGSQGGLIFDVTGAGSGVEVFQPFEVVLGGDHMVQLPNVKDGDQVVSLQLENLDQNGSVAFTIDVDDTAGAREITVSRSEMKGATVSAKVGANNYSAVIGDTPKVTVKTGDCLS
ncbi:aggregation factor core [Shimia thalassica]|uniref:aggregation factor core n=1 Tax=Shimia thalassica TaxID=1715693 RepID=UPI0027372CCA|nr:aggregation factor core [Shimia thalassica]MDP2493054.1 aggregation factor core [Shimia thalassica]